MAKYKVTTFNAIGAEESRTVTASRVKANEHYVSLESGEGMGTRVHLLVPREKLIAVEELT